MPGSYTLHVDAALEDVAGNSLARPFDLDHRLRGRARPASTYVFLVGLKQD
ncbi:hypothetical protein [Gemmatirosa kalamazoonensis]|uniref:hypothetical protein n=1 Tax=Gemmatirosa kalamazoonensis TaxID=861299 RepID=UPI0004BC470A|nr:hypothetical protein [Gemmatirosa kalamazoonensis]